MKRAPLLAVLAIVISSASSAWAQYGLYGSPELLRLPPVQQAGQFSQYDQAARPLPPASARPVADYRMPQPQTTSTAYVPRDPGYPQEVVSPMTQTPVTPAPAIPSLGNTFLSAAPADTAAKPPQRRARKQKPQPQPTPSPGVNDGVVSRMLEESGCLEPNPWSESCADVPCGSMECAPPEACFSSPWFVGASGLVMGRDAPNRVWTTYESANQANQLMHTDFELNWEAGAEITFGRRFCCDRWSVSATYWALNAFSGFASQTAVGDVSTPLDFTGVIYANSALNVPGVPTPQDLFDGAREHRLWRTNEIHNIEINFVSNHVDVWMDDSSMGNPLAVDWMIGARFFRFEEDLTFGSLDSGGYTWAADPDFQGYLEDQCTNNLVGFQIGGDVNYTVWEKWRLFVRPKVGIYNNHIRNSFMAYRGDGELFAPDPAVGVNGSYPVNATADTVSFLTEVNLGLDWQFLPRCSFTVGYRVMMATGIGLADNQIPFYIVDVPELANIDHNGQLVLHGVFSGFELNY